MKKICVITGTRAEYSLLKPIIDKINNEDELKVQIIATGMHLSPEFGLTYKEIESDGYEISEKIEILLSSDTTVGISKSMGLAMISFSECYARLKPDLIIVLGDRYEMFSAVSAAMISRIPVAHLHGGESTEGLVDEAIRHSITKMSYLHFTSTEEYRNRVIQLGEAPERVFNVGAIGIENIKNTKFLSKEELVNQINFNLGDKFAIVTFHPVTLDSSLAEEQFSNVLSALDSFNDLDIIFTKANADTEGRIINQMIDEYVKKNSHRTISFTSMGKLRYLSAVKYASVVIGNSSSGIIEVPELKVPTVNIGDRQKGRVLSESIINCNANKCEIIDAIKKSLDNNFTQTLQNTTHPYGDGEVSSKVVSVIKSYLLDNKIDIKKHFYDLR
ncbi:GDP/UDP-N,N'-diacetylbacillosamine 2-epimerase (hydrolyzing) [Clostridium punense]|uniref:GDP/UDP-N,N'-diacetylbacillosamine 2-epimerase (Hydrolyzing) n=1 Tax=Clostridium punense TaxID=1054297 RepID=A0ABS4K209_9CLOT|nr:MULTISPECIES: UDP-N-acetylglucosamine 2-epimerase [Clostridium]EQB87121.1 hypothetical protein M918_10795 [Clostridium sp. BL8]MBP2021815.1 GDP/UDP-N,N'-diacetylbacillosamine 2-epimerase (hydrolyzing) [Clostridium punense]